MAKIKKYKIAIVGVGGVGGYLGTKLVNRYADDDGIDIVFIQRGDHLYAIKKNGLRYITKNNTYTVIPNLATDDPREAGKIDLAILCVKSYDLEQTALQIAASLKDDSVVLSTLNGVTNGSLLQTLFPDKVILDGCIYISATIERPGVVSQTGGVGELIFGPMVGTKDPLLQLYKLLRDAQIKARLVEEIAPHLWQKYIFVSPLASLTSLYDEPIGAIINNTKHRAMFINLMKEIILLAKKKNITLPDTVIQSCLSRAKIIPYSTQTSMQIDFRLKKKTEVGIFTEYIVNVGKTYHLSLPYHSEVYNQLRDKYNF